MEPEHLWYCGPFYLEHRHLTEQSARDCVEQTKIARAWSNGGTFGDYFAKRGAATRPVRMSGTVYCHKAC